MSDLPPQITRAQRATVIAIQALVMEEPGLSIADAAGRIVRQSVIAYANEAGSPKAMEKLVNLVDELAGLTPPKSESNSGGCFLP